MNKLQMNSTVLAEIEAEIHEAESRTNGEPSGAAWDWAFAAEQMARDLLRKVNGHDPSHLELAHAMIGLGDQATAQGERRETGYRYKVALLRQARQVAEQSAP